VKNPKELRDIDGIMPVPRSKRPERGNKDEGAVVLRGALKIRDACLHLCVKMRESDCAAGKYREWGGWRTMSEAAQHRGKETEDEQPENGSKNPPGNIREDRKAERQLEIRHVSLPEPHRPVDYKFERRRLSFSE
jgi:hypothetical protein